MKWINFTDFFFFWYFPLPMHFWKYSKKISWNWFIWFHEFFGLDFLKFSGLLCVAWVCESLFLSFCLSGSKTLVWQFAKIGIRQFTVGRCPNWSLHLFSFLHNWLFLRNARSFNVLFGFPGNTRTNYVANRFHFGCFQVRHLPLKNKIGSINANLIPYWLFFGNVSLIKVKY